MEQAARLLSHCLQVTQYRALLILKTTGGFFVTYIFVTYIFVTYIFVTYILVTRLKKGFLITYIFVTYIFVTMSKDTFSL